MKIENYSAASLHNGCCRPNLQFSLCNLQFSIASLFALCGSPLCLLPSALSKSLPESNLKTVIIIPRAQISGRTLFVFGNKRETIRHAILDQEHHVRVRGDVR